MRIVVKDAVGGSNDHQSVTLRIPRYAYTRRRAQPCFVAERLCIRRSRITGEQNARRGIPELRAVDSLIEGLLVEYCDRAELVIWRYVRFPSNSAVDGEVGVRFPRVLCVERNV